MIEIIQKGIWPIPDEARKCPVCGQREDHFNLELNLRLSAKRPYLPAFTCERCKTKWQYLGEKEEEKEND